MPLTSRDVEGAAPLIYAVLTLAAGLWYWASRRRWIVFGSGSGALVLFRDRPSPAAVTEFLAAMRRARPEYLARHHHQPEQSTVGWLEWAASLRVQGRVSAESARLKPEIPVDPSPFQIPGDQAH